MSENLIVVLAIVGLVAITAIAFVTIVALLIYFSEKKINAGLKLRAEKDDIKTETNVNIESGQKNDR